jgi:hypothetical protein
MDKAETKASEIAENTKDILKEMREEALNAWGRNPLPTIALETLCHVILTYTFKLYPELDDLKSLNRFGDKNPMEMDEFSLKPCTNNIYGHGGVEVAFDSRFLLATAKMIRDELVERDEWSDTTAVCRGTLRLVPTSVKVNRGDLRCELHLVYLGSL